ncbi:hypothetical protein GCM10023321_47750 [Pseudonocardia eucalypti]|uniref:Uncharacterized protein n=1 Tax=Pseudonocardia eucalypti TaxID=648755 RepID=A0ABP9QI69_9PSEU|nr:hypothetical protein [Pseudonocardia eucalypti]
MADKRLTAFLYAVHSGDPDQVRAVLAEDVVVALQNRLAPTLGVPALALVPQEGGR